VVFEAINGVLFHLRDLPEFALVKTIDAVQKQKRKDNHERQNFGNTVLSLFLEMSLPDDGIQFEGSHRIKYNGVHRAPF
jgi:hypothetical protein